MNCRDDVVERIHRIFFPPASARTSSLRLRALGRAGGPQVAKLIEQIYQQAFSGSALQMTWVAALGKAARGFQASAERER